MYQVHVPQYPNGGQRVRPPGQCGGDDAAHGAPQLRLDLRQPRLTGVERPPPLIQLGGSALLVPFSAFRPNEVENLSRKEDAGGVAVVAVRRDAPAVDCFFPWYYIRDAIESGERGSVKLEGLPTDLLNVLEVVHP